MELIYKHFVNMGKKRIEGNRCEQFTDYKKKKLAT